MVYEHAEKAGNRADVWKHFILSETLERLLSQTPGCKSPFRYFETHGGPGIYRLNEKGEWRNGAAIVARNDRALSDNPYVNSLVSPQTVGGIYAGSWILAGRILLENGRLPILEICDTDPKIESAEYNPEIPASIRRALVLHRADGFETLSRAVRPDFVLIDPPYTPELQQDWKQAISAADRLEEDGVAGLIWYPVFRLTRLAVPETNRPGYELIWEAHQPNAAEKTIGCGIMGTGPARDALICMTHRMQILAEVLSGQFRKRGSSRSFRSCS